MTKDIEKSTYFLEIKVTYQKDELLLFQRKYTLDLLQETGLLGCIPISTLMETDMDF